MSRLSEQEDANVRAFIVQAVKIAGGQSALARSTGIAQATIGGVLADRRAGGRTLRALAQATGVPVDEILNGSGIYRLRALNGSKVDQANTLARLRATRALSELFELTVGEVSEIFDELGIILPEAVPATIWFDAGRSAIERRKNGLEITRRLL